MKKVLLAVLALVQIILGMLLLSSSFSNVFADVHFDTDRSNEWYGTERSNAIISAAPGNTPPAVPVSIINRESH